MAGFGVPWRVRYVVLDTEPPDSGDPGLTEYFRASGFGAYTPDQLATVLASLPPGLVERQITTPNGVVLVSTTRIAHLRALAALATG